MLWSGFILSDKKVAWDLTRGLDLLMRQNKRNGIETPVETLRTRLELDQLLRSATIGPEGGTRGTEKLDQVARLSIKQAAGRLGVSESLVRRLCRTGRLSAVKDGSDSWRIDATAIELHRHRRTP